MFELSRHIEILLLSNDCVIVPNFGGFLTHYIGARYEEKENLFIPPLRTIGFNPQLKLNDHLLVQDYIETYDISYPEALQRIEEDVEEIRQHLSNEGSFELQGLGVLQFNEEGNYEFIPCEAGILTPELYGFDSFQFAPLAATSQQTATTIFMIDSNTDQEEEQPTAPVATQDHDNHDSDHDNAIIVKMSWIRNAVATAVAVLLFFVFTTPVDNSTEATKIQQSSILSVSLADDTATDKELLSDTIPADISSQQTPLATETTPATEKPDSLKAEKETAVEQVTEPAYTICLASQTTRFHAENFVKRMNEKGVTGLRIINMNNSEKVRVVCGSFPSEEEARKSMQHYGDTYREFWDGWILHVND